MVEKNGGGLLSDEERNTLKAAACLLALDTKDENSFVTRTAEGTVKTEWKSYVIGGRSGILFRAQFDTETQKDCQVNFLLSKKDLERGAEILRELEEGGGDEWDTVSSRACLPRELYQFEDLRKSPRTLH